MYEEAICIVKRYIETCVYDEETDKDKIWPLKEFEVRSTAKWAAEEILAKLQEESMNPYPYLDGRMYADADEIIRQYAEDMDDCRFSAESEKTKMVFLIAGNTAWNILEFYKHERRNER